MYGNENEEKQRMMRGHSHYQEQQQYPYENGENEQEKENYLKNQFQKQLKNGINKRKMYGCNKKIPAFQEVIAFTEKGGLQFFQESNGRIESRNSQNCFSKKNNIANVKAKQLEKALINDIDFKKLFNDEQKKQENNHKKKIIGALKITNPQISYIQSLQKQIISNEAGTKQKMIGANKKINPFINSVSAEQENQKRINFCKQKTFEKQKKNRVKVIGASKATNPRIQFVNQDLQEVYLSSETSMKRKMIGATKPTESKIDFVEGSQIKKLSYQKYQNNQNIGVENAKKYKMIGAVKRTESKINFVEDSCVSAKYQHVKSCHSGLIKKKMIGSTKQLCAKIEFVQQNLDVKKHSTNKEQNVFKIKMIGSTRNTNPKIEYVQEAGESSIKNKIIGEDEDSLCLKKQTKTKKQKRFGSNKVVSARIDHIESHYSQGEGQNSGNSHLQRSKVRKFHKNESEFDETSLVNRVQQDSMKKKKMIGAKQVKSAWVSVIQLNKSNDVEVRRHGEQHNKENMKLKMIGSLQKLCPKIDEIGQKLLIDQNNSSLIKSEERIFLLKNGQKIQQSKNNHQPSVYQGNFEQKQNNLLQKRKIKMIGSERKLISANINIIDDQKDSNMLSNHKEEDVEQGSNKNMKQLNNTKFQTIIVKQKEKIGDQNNEQVEDKLQKTDQNKIISKKQEINEQEQKQSQISQKSKNYTNTNYLNYGQKEQINQQIAEKQQKESLNQKQEIKHQQNQQEKLQCKQNFEKIVQQEFVQNNEKKETEKNIQKQQQNRRTFQNKQTFQKQTIIKQQKLNNLSQQQIEQYKIDKNDSQQKNKQEQQSEPTIVIHQQQSECESVEKQKNLQDKNIDLFINLNEVCSLKQVKQLKMKQQIKVVQNQSEKQDTNAYNFINGWEEDKQNYAQIIKNSQKYEKQQKLLQQGYKQEEYQNNGEKQDKTEQLLNQKLCSENSKRAFTIQEKPLRFDHSEDSQNKHETIQICDILNQKDEKIDKNQLKKEKNNKTTPFAKGQSQPIKLFHKKEEIQTKPLNTMLYKNNVIISTKPIFVERNIKKISFNHLKDKYENQKIDESDEKNESFYSRKSRLKNISFRKSSQKKEDSSFETESLNKIRSQKHEKDKDHIAPYVSPYLCGVKKNKKTCKKEFYDYRTGKTQERKTSSHKKIKQYQTVQLEKKEQMFSQFNKDPFKSPKQKKILPKKNASKQKQAMGQNENMKKHDYLRAHSHQFSYLYPVKRLNNSEESLNLKVQELSKKLNVRKSCKYQTKDEQEQQNKFDDDQSQFWQENKENCKN